jgi:hypothetical protein
MFAERCLSLSSPPPPAFAIRLMPYYATPPPPFSTPLMPLPSLRFAMMPRVTERALPFAQVPDAQQRLRCRRLLPIDAQRDTPAIFAILYATSPTPLMPCAVRAAYAMRRAKRFCRAK